MARILPVRNFVAELHSEGKIEDKPYITHDPRVSKDLNHYYVIERKKDYFIAAHTVLRLPEQKNNPTTYDPSKLSSRSIACFPNNPDIAHIFGNSHVREFGPQNYFPGAVVAAHYSFVGKGLGISYIQFCFKQGSPTTLSRSLASKHIGFRHKLIDHILDNARDITFIEAERPMKRGGNCQAVRQVMKNHAHLNDFVEIEWGWTKREQKARRW